MLPVNPYSRQSTSRSKAWLQFYATHIGLPYKLPFPFGFGGWTDNIYDKAVTADSLGISTTIPSADISDAQVRCLQRLQDNLNGVDWDALTFSAELGKTSSMLRDRVNKTYDYADSFRRKRSHFYDRTLRRLLSGLASKRERKQMFRDLTNAYLEFTYGWNPLAGDVESAAKYLYNTFEKHPRSTISASASVHKIKYGNELSYGFGAGALYYKVQDEYEVKVRAGGILLSPDGFGNPPERLGLTLGNVALSLYELTTFSFLADYVSNLQYVVGNLSGALMKTHASSLYLSTKYRVIRRIIPTRVTWTDSDVIRYINTMSYYNSTPILWRKFTRTNPAWYELLVPFRFEPPSWRQIANTTVLFSALLSRAKKPGYT